MSLRNQPYFPLYVQDYLTDEKLNSCSAESQGVYIKILCVLHKQDEYGFVLLKQKDKQTDKQILNFALKLAKLLPFDTDTVLNAITELVEEKVMIIEGDKIYQKRMVKDGNISLLRSKAGKEGGGNPILYKQNSKQNSKQTLKQNPEDESEYETEDINDNKDKNPSKKAHEEIKKEKELEIKFELFWATYPRHVSKVNAVKSFRKINPDQDLFNKIISSLKKQIEFGMYTDKNFTPHPATWLNQERWNDEVIPKNHIYIEPKKSYEPTSDFMKELLAGKANAK